MMDCWKYCRCQSSQLNCWSYSRSYTVQTFPKFHRKRIVMFLSVLLLWLIPQATAGRTMCSAFRMSPPRSCQTVRYFVPKTIRMALVPGRSQTLQQASAGADPAVLDCIQAQLDCEIGPESGGQTSCHSWNRNAFVRLNGTIDGTLLEFKVCRDETLRDRCMIGAPKQMPGRTNTMMIVHFRSKHEKDIVSEYLECDCRYFEIYHTNLIEKCYKVIDNKQNRNAWFVVAGLIAVLGGSWLVYYGVTTAMGRAKRRRLQSGRDFMTRDVNGSDQNPRF